MHIAILMANTDESTFAQGHPKDGEKFQALLADHAPGWRFSVFSVKDGVFPDDPAAFDGFLITGSPASVNDSDPWIARLFDLIRAIAALDRPLFGACFGHQAIAAAMGGEVGANPGGWVLGLVDTEMGGTPLSLYAAHREQVLRLPDGAVANGGNSDCLIGSFRLGPRILTTQYHPEMTPGFIAALVEELGGKLPPDVISRARASLGRTADRDAIAGRIAGFLAGA